MGSQLDPLPLSRVESRERALGPNFPQLDIWWTFKSVHPGTKERVIWDGDQDEWQANQLFTWTCTNQTISWLVHNWSTFGAQINHGQTWMHKTHHGPNLGEATTFSFIIFFVHGHESNIQMSFCPTTFKLGVSKFLKLGCLQLWNPIMYFFKTFD